MDLMIDCMPLYEMLEDDMQTIANLNSSLSNTSSPSCLSDEEQLALSSTNILDTFSFLNTSNVSYSNTNATSNLTPGTTTIATNVNTFNTHYEMNQTAQHQQQQVNQHQQQSQILDNSYSFNSLSPTTTNCSSSTSSSVSSSSASSPLSLSMSSSSLCNAFANTSFNFSSSSACSSNLSSPINTPSSYHQPNNFNANNPHHYQQQHDLNSSASNSITSNSKYMQDSYMNSNYNFYEVVNPMDINSRNFNTHLQSHYYDEHSTNTNNTPSNNKPQLNKNNSAPIQLQTISLTRQATSSSNLNTQPVKRGKFSHYGEIVKQEALSDGESINSNECDSNSSNSSSGSNVANRSNNIINLDDKFNHQHKKFIITTNKQGVLAKNPHLTIINPNDLNKNLNVNSNLVATTDAQVLKLSTINNNHNNGVESNENMQFNTNSLELRGDSFKFSIATKKLSNDGTQTTTPSANHKTIIQYKELINTNNNALNGKHSANSTKPKQINLAENHNSSTNQGQVALRPDGKAYPKPPYSYSCLIAMSLRNSDSGTLPVSDIYDFIIENFPYYKTARDGWKNSIRHNLSLNKCFEKIENPTNGSKKGCLWALNPDKCKKLEEECKRCRQRDPVNIRLSMSRPDDLNKIERGEQRLKKHGTQNQRKIFDTNNDNQNGLVSPTANNTGNQLINNDKFLMDWTNKNFNSSSSLFKEDYFDNLTSSDVKFEPIVLSNMSSSLRVNI